MMARPMKTLELHYPTIQFLIMKNITLLLHDSRFPTTDSVNILNPLAFGSLKMFYPISQS